MADPLHQTAIPCDNIGVVVYQLIGKFAAQMGFGHRHTHRIGNALPQRACRGFNAGSMAIFRMASGCTAQLAKIAKRIQRCILIAGQI